jgi:hypothetical protein
MSGSINTPIRDKRSDGPVFGTSHLIGQFVLSPTKKNVPEEWPTERSGDWFLGRHPSLPAIRLLGDNNCTIGWFLGYPIDKKGQLLGEGDAIREPELWNGSMESVEHFVYGFGGRFLVALVGIRNSRIYLDPCGSLSLVYCPHQKVIASTPNLIPYDEQTRDRVDLARELGIPYTNAMYPLNLTPRNNIERLLPNHYLDLSNWQSVRHWPKKPLHSDESVEEAIVAIGTIVKRNIAAVVSKTPTYLCLTAGHDSRMVLACARDVVDRLELLTVPIPDDGARIDIDTARKIAKRFNIRHFVPKQQKPKQEDLDEYMFRIGYSTGEVRGWQAATTNKQANPAYALLYGQVGGLERIPSPWSREDVPESTKITPERLLELLEAPRTELILAPLRRWLETVPAVKSFQVIDLFTIEQRFGCWAGVWPYAESNGPGFIIFPMCHREVVERMLTLPTQYRRSGTLMKDVIKREWPELLAWPFNKALGFLHLLFTIRWAANGIQRRILRLLRNGD